MAASIAVAIRVRIGRVDVQAAIRAVSHLEVLEAVAQLIEGIEARAAR